MKLYFLQFTLFLILILIISPLFINSTFFVYEKIGTYYLGQRQEHNNIVERILKIGLYQFNILLTIDAAFLLNFIFQGANQNQTASFAGMVDVPLNADILMTLNILVIAIHAIIRFVSFSKLNLYIGYGTIEMKDKLYGYLSSLMLSIYVIIIMNTSIFIIRNGTSISIDILAMNPDILYFFVGMFVVPFVFPAITEFMLLITGVPAELIEE